MDHKRRNARQNLFSFGSSTVGNDAQLQLKSYQRRLTTEPPTQIYSNYNYPPSFAYQDYTQSLAEVDLNTPKFFARKNQLKPTPSNLSIKYPPVPSFSHAGGALPCKCCCTHTQQIPRDYSQNKFDDKRPYFYDPSIEEISRKYGIQPKVQKTFKQQQQFEPQPQKDIYTTPRQESRDFRTNRAKSHAKFNSKAVTDLTNGKDQGRELSLAKTTSGYNNNPHTLNERRRLRTELPGGKEQKPCQFFLDVTHDLPSDSRTSSTLLSINDLSERINQKVNRILSQCQDY